MEFSLDAFLFVCNGWLKMCENHFLCARSNYSSTVWIYSVTANMFMWSALPYRAMVAWCIMLGSNIVCVLNASQYSDPLRGSFSSLRVLLWCKCSESFLISLPRLESKVWKKGERGGHRFIIGLNLAITVMILWFHHATFLFYNARK